MLLGIWLFESGVVLPLPAEAIEGGIRKKAKDRRKTRARVRQGEWFFVPRPQTLRHRPA